MLSIDQLEAIIGVFNETGINFDESSMEIHPSFWNPKILDLGFFNRLSVGIQSFEQEQLRKWRRPEDTQAIVFRIMDTIYRSSLVNSVNFDLLFHTELSTSDLTIALQLSPDTIVIYPITRMRSEKEAAHTFYTLEKAAQMLNGYSRVTPSSFHFYKKHNDLSVYANCQYTCSADIIGFGHNSISYIGPNSWLSIYNRNCSSWTIRRRNHDLMKELFYTTVLYGVSPYVYGYAEYPGKYLLKEDKKNNLIYLPPDLKAWTDFRKSVEVYEDPGMLPTFWGGLFWTDPREKNLSRFFAELEQLREADFRSLIATAVPPLPIPNRTILIEGIDGSGKDSFTAFLFEYLKLFSSRCNGRSISITGLPSSRLNDGAECRRFIEDAVMDHNYDEMCKMLRKNRYEYMQYVEHEYPGIRFYIRGILTEFATLERLYGKHAVICEDSTKTDLFIYVDTLPEVARERIANRGIKETWRESIENLKYFREYYLSHKSNFKVCLEVDNSLNSIVNLKMQAYRIALKIYEMFYLTKIPYAEIGP